jgi:hypothetical protein
MKNITISMEDGLASAVRVDAAKAGVSMSKFLAEAARQKIEHASTPEKPKRNLQLEALERIFAGPGWDVTENGRMPTADERNAR